MVEEEALEWESDEGLALGMPQTEPSELGDPSPGKALEPRLALVQEHQQSSKKSKFNEKSLENLKTANKHVFE